MRESTSRRPSLHGGTPTTLVELESIEVILGGSLILQDINVEIGTGEVVALLGPNGAGKSTLLRVIAGELKPASGRPKMTLLGTESPDSRTLARHRAVVSQRVAAPRGYTVSELVALGLLPHPAHAPATESAWLKKALTSVQAIHLADRDVTTLSGGELQRVHLARAMVQLLPTLDAGKSALLLLDEPTANQDPGQARAFAELIRELRREHGLGIVVVAHDLNLAAAIADRIVLLADGAVLADGLVDDVFNGELLSDAYGTSLEVLTHPSTSRPFVSFFQ